MTKISVSTGPLAAAASRLQAQSRAAGERGHGVEAALRGLDLEIKAREHIDARLRALSSQLSLHARQLSAQGRFLSYAVGRYEGAEEQVIASQARGEAHIGVGSPGEIEVSPSDDGEDRVRPTSLNEILRQYGEAAFGGDDEEGEALADFVGAVPVLGTFLTFDEIVADLQNRETGGASWKGVNWLFEKVVSEGVGESIPLLGSVISLNNALEHVWAAYGRAWASAYPPPQWVSEWSNSDIGEFAISGGLSGVPIGGGALHGFLRGWMQG